MTFVDDRSWPHPSAVGTSASSGTQVQPDCRQGAVAAVVVTYFPGPILRNVVKRLAAQVDYIYIVDNSGPEASEDWDWLKEFSDVALIENDGNKGVGAALNSGMSRALEAGYQFAIALDQDSVPSPDLVRSLMASYRNHPSPETVAVVGATIVESAAQGRTYKWLIDQQRWSIIPIRKGGQGHDYPAVTTAITSGSLYRLSLLKELGWFNEELFIDLVDTEFCLRARSRGLLTATSDSAILHHTRGNRKEIRFWRLYFYPTDYPPLRRYYQARNLLVVIGRHGLTAPYWVVFELSATIRNLAFDLLCGLRKGVYLRAWVQGLLDGVNGRQGPAPRSFQSESYSDKKATARVDTSEQRAG